MTAIEATIYELSPGALFRDLFKGSLGSVGICDGYGRFRPGSSLPCHFHEYDAGRLQTELDAPAVIRRRDHADGAAGDIAIRVLEIRVIEEVKQLRAKLHICPLSQVENFRRREVQGLKTRPFNIAPQYPGIREQARHTRPRQTSDWVSPPTSGLE